MPNKIKLQELLAETAGDALVEAIKTVKPKYKGKPNSELSELLGLTDHQFNHLVDKALGSKLEPELKAKINDRLMAGDSIEIPDTCNIFVYESSNRTNEQGTPLKKLSIRTREAMKRELNE